VTQVVEGLIDAIRSNVRDCSNCKTKPVSLGGEATTHLPSPNESNSEWASLLQSQLGKLVSILHL
jgi:hypothetical protein